MTWEKAPMTWGAHERLKL